MRRTMLFLFVVLYCGGSLSAGVAQEGSTTSPSDELAKAKPECSSTDTVPSNNPSPDSPGTSAGNSSADASSGDTADRSSPDTSDTVLAGHSYHGEAFNEGPRQAAFLMPGTGRIEFEVGSKVPLVQEFINQGVGQLHGFWYFEAERSFRQAAALDPDCAAAYWGMAMANVNNRERAQEFITEAKNRIDQATPRVRRYIEAAAEFLKQKTTKESAQAYVDALEQIVHEYPDDIDAKAFIAVQLWQARRLGLKIPSYLAVDALIKQVLAVQPLHPVHHYCIHLWDDERPQRALDSAAKCGQSAPAIAHMWHMPGHIYSKLKRYPDAVWQQEASARTDHAQMMRDGLLPDQIHNFAHNNEWLIRNLIFVGRIRDAVDLAQNMLELPRHPKYNTLEKRGSSAAYGRVRLFQVLNEAELWQEVRQLAETMYLEPGDRLSDKIARMRLLGRAYLRQAELSHGVDVIAQLEVLLCDQFARREQSRLQAGRKADAENKSGKEREKLLAAAGEKFKSDIRRIEESLHELYGILAAQNGSYQKAIELLDKAKQTDVHYLASLKLKIGQTDEAVELVRDHVKSRENQTVPLARQASILWQAGRKEEAREVMQKLREISSFVDLDAPPFARLSPLVDDLGWPQDWRVAFEPAEDVGDRPALDSLGPFRWQPMQAADWTLTAADGHSISLSQFREQDKPVIVIFYLGYGCLHCAEQLQAFAPRAKDFEEVGIELVAISSDPQTDLEKSLKTYDGQSIPFPLVSDSRLDVFRKYRVYDDFEQQPLHATFLIDAAGRVRWHDISYEPFMDPQFVLNEAQRLLAQNPLDQEAATLAGRQRWQDDNADWTAAARQRRLDGND